MTEEMLLALGDLVHDELSKQASQVINDAREIEFLVSRGWTENEIMERLAE
jgi:hypothetical protein